MSCCGKNRNQMQIPAPQADRTDAKQRAVSTGTQATFRSGPKLVVEYRGKGSVRVQGPATGRIYCFSGPGTRMILDPRDRDITRTILGLRIVELG